MDADRRRPAPAGVRRGRRLPGLRRRRRALRAARDVLDAGRALQRGAHRTRAASSPTSSSTRRGSCCCACRTASRSRREPPEPLAVEDTWILSRLQAAEAEVAEAIEAFEFHRAAQKIYDFVYGELCDWYLEMLKPRLYVEDNAETARVRAARAGRDARAGAPGDPVRHRGDLDVPARPEGPADGPPLAGRGPGAARPGRRGRGRSGRSRPRRRCGRGATASARRRAARAGAARGRRLRARGRARRAARALRVLHERRRAGGDGRRARRQRRRAGVRGGRPRGREAPRGRAARRRCARRSRAPRASSATRASWPRRPTHVVQAEREKLEQLRRELDELS